MKPILNIQDEMSLDTASGLSQAKEDLAASELRYRRLFESVRDGILILDAETGMVLDVNPFLIELLGFTREAFLGKAIWELGFFKDIVATQENFTQLQQTTYIRYDDKPLETADGRRIDVEFISNVYLVNHKEVIQCNIRNITEHKKAEEVVRALSSRQEAILSAIPAKILMMEDEKAICTLTASLLAPFGHTVVTALDGQEAIAQYKQALEAGSPFDVVIMDLTIPGGPGGKEVIQALLAMDPNVRAIVSSGYAFDPVMTNPARYGFKGTVAKPYTGRALREAVARILA